MPTLHQGNIYQYRPELQRLHQLDFLAWYVDRWGGKETDLIWSLHPEYKDHQWDGTPDPLYKVVCNLTDGISTAVQAATGVGKTWLESIITFWHLDVFRDARIITVGESADGLERTLWEEEIRPKFPKFKKLVPSAFAYKIMKIIGDQQDMNESDEVVNWQVKGIGVRKRSGEQSSGALQGIHGKRFLILIDECAKVDPAIVEAVINTCTDPEFNLVFGFGNPDNQLDALYQLGEFPHIDRIRISAKDFPNVVCGRRIIPGAVTVDSLRIREKKYGVTGSLYLSRVRGISAEDTKNTLLKRSVVKSRINFTPTVGGQFAGVDVANSEEGDEAALTYLKGNQIAYVKSFKCPNANAIALNMLYEGKELEDYLTKDRRGNILKEPLPNYNLPTIYEYKVHPSDTGVDVIGVGVGTVNEFVAHNNKVYAFVAGGSVMSDEDLLHLIEYDEEGRPLETFGDKRTMAFYLTKRDFENGDLGWGPDVPLDTINQASKEASAYRLTASTGSGSSRHIRLEPKFQTRKRLLNMASPNIWDSICIANFMRHLNGYGISTDSYGYSSIDIPRK